jgi:O-succinylbenzoic acid--CoA ligase
VYETYGMTETVTHIAAKSRRTFRFFLSNIKVSQNEMNCLVIDAPKISHEQIVTNDLVELINDHQFILLGRIDNVVNSGGIKLIPEQRKIITWIHSIFCRWNCGCCIWRKLVLVIEGKATIG